jgi:hypothetical protein
MEEDQAGDGRRILDEAVARTRALGTAWVRHYARAGHDAPHAQDLRLEGAVDLRRRVCVAGEADPAPGALTTSAGPSPSETEPTRRVVYAGGSRFVAGAEGWEKTEGDVDGPRLAADPLWLLDALRYAVDRAVTPEDGGVRVDARLDLSEAGDIDRSALVPATRWRGLVHPLQRRRREEWLRGVPCEVTIDGERLIRCMAYAVLPAEDGVEPVWTTTEVVEYGVPVDMPDLLARSRPAAWRGRRSRAPMPTR